MPFASSSAMHSLKGRSIPLSAAVILSATLYSAHTYYSPILADSEPPTSKARPLIPNVNPYTPLGWGSNRYLTLSPDSNTPILKKPTPLSQFGSTPLRDLVIAEKYGACVDANGDLWFWGAGYDPSGQTGRSLKGKVGKIPIPVLTIGHCDTGTCSRKGSRVEQEGQALRRLGVQSFPRCPNVSLRKVFLEQNIQCRPRSGLCRAQSRGRSRSRGEMGKRVGRYSPRFGSYQQGSNILTSPLTFRKHASATRYSANLPRDILCPATGIRPSIRDKAY